MIYLPITFQLIGQTWTIRAANQFELVDDLGLCNPDQLEIIINPNQAEDSMLHTILHEIIHSIEIKLCLELTERQVDLLALGILDLLKSNRDFIVKEMI